MEEIINKDIATKLMEIKGETRGIALKSDQEFVLQEKGEEGVKLLQKTMQELGFPIDYAKIRPMDFCPVGLRAISLLIMKAIFDFDDEKFRKMGMIQSKTSLIIRLFMKYFISLSEVAKKVPDMWEKYYTIGVLTVTKISEEKKYGILKLENFRLHPLQCRVLEGYFASIISMVVKSPVICRETKCIFKGDGYHEFSAKW